MVASTFELFKVGVGPSSSHTMGPMTASADFVASLGSRCSDVGRVTTTLYGSLALTGKGHATDRAIMLGLSGERPATIDPDRADAVVAEIRLSRELKLAGEHGIGFDEDRDLIILQRERLPFHSNAMRFEAFDGDGVEIGSRVAYSVGGGAVVTEQEVERNAPPDVLIDIPHPFSSGDALLARAQQRSLSIAEMMRENECAVLGPGELSDRLLAIRAAMSGCIDRGVEIGGVLPGGLAVKRRAPDDPVSLKRTRLSTMEPGL